MIVSRLLACTACLILAHAHSTYAADAFVAPVRLAPTDAVDIRPGDREGWVVVQFMVDTEGRPFELGVFDHAGDPRWIDAALSIVEAWRFTPGRLGDRTIESALRSKISFPVEGADTVPRRRFVQRFRRALRTIEGGAQAQARQYVDELGALSQNLFEDALQHVALASFEAKWGDREAQFGHVAKAIAYEETSTYLPDEFYLRMLRNRFLLEVGFGRLGEARATFETHLGFAGFVGPEMRRAHEALEALASDDRAFDVAGDFADRSAWNIALVKDEFALTDVVGNVERVKLRCAHNFAALTVTPDQAYRVPASFGRCSAEFFGTPGTTFVLTQT